MQPRQFLGMEFDLENVGQAKLRNTNLINKILQQTVMSDANSLKSPLNPELNLGEISFKPSEDDKRDYRSNLGTLLYLATMARPDFCLAARVLGSQVYDSSERQAASVKRVLRFRWGTMAIRMILDAGVYAQLSAYVDSNCAAEPSTKRKSRTGIIVRYGSSPIQVSSDLQNSRALSTSNGAYFALSDARRANAWLRQVLQESHILQRPTVVFQDTRRCLE